VPALTETETPGKPAPSPDYSVSAHAPPRPADFYDRDAVMSTTIPDWLPPTEVKQTDRDRPHRRDPREGRRQERPQPVRPPPERAFDPDAAGGTPHIGVLIDVRA